MKKSLQELAAKGLDTKGNKNDLVGRLSAHEAGLTPVDPSVRLGTLVVCPMSVIHNWEAQFAEHVKEGALDVSRCTCVQGFDYDDDP